MKKSTVGVRVYIIKVINIFNWNCENLKCEHKPENKQPNYSPHDGDKSPMALLGLPIISHNTPTTPAPKKTVSQTLLPKIV